MDGGRLSLVILADGLAKAALLLLISLLVFLITLLLLLLLVVVALVVSLTSIKDRLVLGLVSNPVEGSLAGTVVATQLLNMS